MDAGTRSCVLIVEDDPDLRDGLGEWLQAAGYPTALAANGQEALEYLHTHQAPCLVLLDLMMPVMDGCEFRQRQVKDPSLSKVPVVVLSALGPQRSSSLVPGVDAYLEKPVDFTKLLQAIASRC
jgi:CheY-like chemotaxis protein